MKRKINLSEQRELDLARWASRLAKVMPWANCGTPFRRSRLCSVYQPRLFGAWTLSSSRESANPLIQTGKHQNNTNICLDTTSKCYRPRGKYLTLSWVWSNWRCTTRWQWRMRHEETTCILAGLTFTTSTTLPSPPSHCKGIRIRGAEHEFRYLVMLFLLVTLS